MRFTRKGFLAVLAGATVLISSASMAFANQLPVAQESSVAAYSNATNSNSSQIGFTLRKFYPAGEGRYAYVLMVSCSLSDVVKLEYRTSPGGTYFDVPYDRHIVGTTDTYSFSVEVRATLKDGSVHTNFFTYNG